MNCDTLISQIHRLCGWLLDNGYFQIAYFNQCFLFALQTIKGIVLQNRILSDFVAGIHAEKNTVRTEEKIVTANKNG